MSAKAIREAAGKDLLRKFVKSKSLAESPCAVVTQDTDWTELAQKYPWLLTEKLVVKPDQLIKRRGKLGLIKVNTDLNGAKEWLQSRLGQDIQVGSATGRLKNFIIEPFVPHQPAEEVYVCIYCERANDVILFHHQGGVDVGDVDAKAVKYSVGLQEEVTAAKVKSNLLGKVPAEKQDMLADFIQALYQQFRDLYFTYLEINPLVVTDKVYILDLAAKIDSTAEFLCKVQWGDLEFPPPFGREAFAEEAYIADLDAKSGASLKLTILNPKGRIWTMVAGGGASVIYSDTICDLGGASELANYGEYSGAPSEQQTYEYAKTVIGLMTKGDKHPDGKVLIIGGGIANFTNVASTFKGIVRALKELRENLKEYGVSIFVRRGGPNYQEGLRVMRELGSNLGVPMHVFGTETHMTAIVGMALGKRSIPDTPPMDNTTASFLLSGSASANLTAMSGSSSNPPRRTSSTSEPTATGTTNGAAPSTRPKHQTPLAQKPLFKKSSTCFIFGMQNRAVQGMLDFDHSCQRETPSVVAMIYPFVGDHKQKFYWGHKEILVPVYKSMAKAMKLHPKTDIMINFASLRSAYDSTVETLQFPQIRTIAIIAEGIPENKTRLLVQTAKEKGVTIIGPATVGGIKPGCFKIGNTGGMLDNILSSKLYRPGSVAYVSRSGGMSNELNNIISRNTDGVFEGVAIGGDRYPGTTFLDHLLRYHDDPAVKMLVLLGEVGGIEEYEVCNAIENGRINKPIVAWCIGTCSTMFSSEVQFGHAGACANAERETSGAKNQALRVAGAYVPSSFDDLDKKINEVYNQLVEEGKIVPQPEVPPPTVPMDFNWARELGLIRKPASFMTSIVDERGQELLYGGMPISDVFEKNVGIGGTLSLLWFQRRLPPYATKFLEMCLIISADHGPAVSGAHNCIVTARAGKDLISSLCSGLLTIGERFGGALDGAAKQYTEAYDSGLIPMEFVNKMRAEHKLIMGIGHRVKSLNNPDKRVVILKEYAQANFPATPLLDWALKVEKITTAKKPNLILNVDGVIGAAMVDLLRNCGAFTSEEAAEYVEMGTLNALFVLGRSMGFIGHYLDQRRLKQGLYRHPWDDISYILPEYNA
ncbi:ATP-citrate synthase-like isoform X1 [Apostichopus japonicus]|uniref:ATP-citrate synthase-like isoform X1 n=1 Tax=Stichopus japonicus TaxID=307972 RepID=UPI003AB5846C